MLIVHVEGKLQSEAGTCPVNTFPCRFSDDKAEYEPSESGSEPPMLFKAKFSNVALYSEPSELGNVPERPNDGRESALTYVLLPIVTHVMPVHAF